MDIDKNWRPDEWPKIRKELAETPNVWGTAMPLVSHEARIVEATATRIIEEFLKFLRSDNGAKPKDTEAHNVSQIIEDSIKGANDG